ncbi:MAG TPA: ATP-binding protein, partial [Candidatus Omnitrophota bacterium]|nr:ATP-binding protein [Candidatus Omnitrophota bacterium]
MSFYVWSLIATGSASIVLGAVVYLQGRSKAANGSLALFTLAVGTWCLAQAAGELVPDKASVIFWTRINLAGAILIPAFYLLFVSSFLDDLKNDVKLLTTDLTIAAILLAADLFTPLMVADVAAKGAYRYYPVPGPVYIPFALFLIGCVAVGIRKLIAGAGSSFGERRNQILYIILAAAVGFGGGATAFFPVFNLGFPSLAHFFVPAYIVIAVYAILKHHLLDIRLVIRGSIVYSALTLLFTGLYTFLVFLFKEAFQSITGWNSILATVVLIFAGVVTIEPARRYIQSLVDRIFFRGSYYYQRTIDNLSAENLKLYRDLLQSEKLASLGTMSAGLAHEIKNPLASIKGMTQILPDNLDDPEFLAKYTEIVPRQLDRINSIIESLLRIGRPARFATVAVDLGKVIGDIIKLVEADCRKKNIKISAELPSGMATEGDPEQLTQAFMNLILNAIDAMRTGGELKVISDRAKGEAGKDMIWIEISDSGEGIAEEDVGKIFDPFFTTKERGTGLGLALTYRI